MGGRCRVPQRGSRYQLRKPDRLRLMEGRTAVPGPWTPADSTEEGVPHQANFCLCRASRWPRAGHRERTEAKQTQGVSGGRRPMAGCKPPFQDKTQPDGWDSDSKDPGPPACDLKVESRPPSRAAVQDEQTMHSKRLLSPRVAGLSP